MRSIPNDLSPAAIAALGTLLAVSLSLAGGGHDLSATLGDTDDAKRLVSVRELLAGAPWFDTTLSRFGAPEPLVSHWSRLIDLPIAALIAAFRLFASPTAAETAGRAIWPLMPLFATLWLLARYCRQRAGPAAAMIAVALAATCDSAMFQFRIGRIDHHNVQILCAVGGLLLLARSFADRKSALQAGMLIGVGLAVGYEAIALVAVALAFAGLLAVIDREQTATLARVTCAAAMALAVAFAATVPPWRWLAVHCDALSLNIVLLTAIGGLGLAALARWGSKLSLPARLTALGGIGLLALAAYAGPQPLCLAGPFAEVDPAVKSIWLDEVFETYGLVRLYGSEPQLALTFAALAVAGMAAMAITARRPRDREQLMLDVCVVASVALAAWQVKLIPYASLLLVVALALAIARLPGTASLSATSVKLAAFVLVNQLALATAVSVLAPAAEASTAPARPRPALACNASANYRSLAALTPGLVVGDVDIGPYIVALTPHRVLAAPYHRLAPGIIAADRILKAPPEESRRLLAALGAGYVALCRTHDENPPVPGSLRAHLDRGAALPFLEPLQRPAGLSLRAWRIVGSAR